MATRVSGDLGLTGQLLISELKRRTAKRESQANFIGLRRDLALSDVDDPSDSLNNVLEKISLTEVGESNQYGRSYNALDWNVTSDFIDEDIDKSFLSRLKDVSIGGGSLGSTVPLTPRIRIQDRISFLNSFYGEGSYPGLHSGPDAMYYRGPEPKHIGYVKFTFNSGTGAVTVTELKQPNGTTNLSTSSILGTEDFITLDLESYETTDNTIINLSGTGISLKLQSPSTWTVSNGLSNLIGVQNSVSQSVFGTLRFKLVRPYSFLHKPLWFTQLPGDPIEPGGADDSDLSTTNRIMRNDSGQIKPLIDRGYWYSRAYVETRWTPTEFSLLTNNQQNNTIIVEDSNMRWQNPPTQIRSEIYNWGIRWDGYLRIDPGIYALEVQTNVAVKIDMAVGTGGDWVNVFDTDTAARESEQMYVSGQSFNTDNVSSTYKYIFGSDPATDWIGYVPITVRMYHGGPDKINLEDLVPNEPDLFIKTTSLSAGVKFHSKQYAVTLSEESGGIRSLTTTPSQDLTEIINILQDSSYSVNYRLTAQGDDILSPSIAISLTTNGSSVTSNTTGLSATGYTLTISPNRSGVNFNDNLTALWKGRIASPSPTHVGYVDLTNGSYEPNLQKTPFDLRPDWWKVSEGHPYDRAATATDDNTPIYGFLRNSFSPVLKSDVEGLGLYGDGGDPITYSSKPNIILGEARYGSQSKIGSNYYGLRLIPNLVGEGGRLNITALPVNNSAYDDTTLLGQSDLGGNPNHLTVANGKVSENTIRLFLANVADTDEKYNKYYTVAVFDTLPTTNQQVSVTYFNNTNKKYYTWSGSAYVENTTPSSDNPVSFGFPVFSDNAWLSPITCSVVKTGSTFLTAPLVMMVEKFTLTSSPNDINFLQFSTTQPSLLTGGADVNLFNGQTLTYYTENNVAFQYLRVDSGEGISFSDVLKLTYNTGNQFNGSESEVPRPPSDRVTPFGFDKPEFTSGLCYPPYSIANTLLSKVAIEDTTLYNPSTPVGNYDVFWGDPTRSGLGSKTLTVTEKLEFQQQISDPAVGTPPSGVNLEYDDYTHRLKIDIPLPKTGIYTDDMLVHIGNQEKIKESYYAYVKLD